MAIDTSNLSGYAKAFAENYNKTGSYDQATKAATAAMGGSGLSSSEISRIRNSGSSSNSSGSGVPPAVKYDFSYPYTPPGGYANTLQNTLPTYTAPDYGDILDKVMARMPQAPKPQPTLTYKQGMKQAEGVYNPLYEQLIPKALEAVDQNNIRRGFFGQLPGAALSRSTAADLQNQKAQAIGQLANQLVGQSQANANTMQQLAQQQYASQANALLSALSSAMNYEQNNQGNLIGLLNAINAQKQQEENSLANLLPWLINY
jgi:hypothetical protein